MNSIKENIDLFEDYTNLPVEVQIIIDEMANDNQDYQDLEIFKKRMEAEGYTFEYDLDGIAFDLQKNKKNMTNIIQYIPTEQKEIITNALINCLQTNLKLNEDTDEHSYLIHDLLTLIGISKSPLFALIPKDEIDNFCSIHGVDFPQYIITDDDKTKESIINMEIEIKKQINKNIELHNEEPEFNKIETIVQSDYDRVIYIFKNKEDIIGINYHQGVQILKGTYEHPCKKLTSIFEMTDNKLDTLERVNISIYSYLHIVGVFNVEDNVYSPKEKQKFNVVKSFYGSTIIEVEANSEDEAIQIAEDMKINMADYSEVHCEINY